MLFLHFLIQWNLGSRTNFPSKKVSDDEHASWQQRQAESIGVGVSCWLTLAQYTSLLDFGLRTFRFTNGLQERIKFVNRGSTVQSFQSQNPTVRHISFHDFFFPGLERLCCKPIPTQKVKLLQPPVCCSMFPHIMIGLTRRCHFILSEIWKAITVRVRIERGPFGWRNSC
jgi:hypothetical protein